MLDLIQMEQLTRKITDKLNNHLKSRGEEPCFIAFTPYVCESNSVDDFYIEFKNYEIFNFKSFDPKNTSKSWEQQIIDSIKLKLHELQKVTNISLTI